MPPVVLLGVGIGLAGTGVTMIQAAESPLWLLLGWVLTVSGVACLLLAAAGTVRAQRAIPGLGGVRWVRDHDYRVVRSRDLAERDAKLEQTTAALAEVRAVLESPKESSREKQPVTFTEIKPRIEGYIKEGRDMYAVLLRKPDPDRTGTLYDEIGDWSKRAYADLDAYHHDLAWDFRRGGHIYSPQFDDIHPTDAETLKTYVGRRGQVLRNVLDGTPGKDLEWN